MAEVRFVDVTLRDGHASLWAEGMTTGMMLPVAPRIERSGFKAIEIIATSHFLKCIRELKEDPWERIRLVKSRCQRTPLWLMMHVSVRAFDLTPYSVLELWMRRIKANGIDEVQLMEASNDFSYRVPQVVKFAKEAGLKVIMAFIFSLAPIPRYTDQYYAERAKKALDLGVDALYIKDSSGLLTPDRVKPLLREIRRSVGEVDIELHSHCNTGLAPIVYLEAAKEGIRTFHTAIPPLSDSNSLPSIFNVSENLRCLGYRPDIELGDLEYVRDHFMWIAKREGFPIGAPVHYTVHHYEHQIPGGVISNLKHQLGQLRMLHRFDEVVQEIIKVRKDLGYPIMVTPFSQFIVSQATLNVMMGERYKQVTDEIIKLVLGFWGDEAAKYMDPDLRRHILSLPRSQELSKWNIPEPSIEEIREELGRDLSDDELLLHYISSRKEVERMKEQKKKITEYTTNRDLTLQLVSEIIRRPRIIFFQIETEDIKITMKKI